MLEYLVTSKVRRHLLEVLWVQKKSGSVAELAGFANVAFSGAHMELKEMYRLQLVVSEQLGGKEVYSANFDHPGAKVLRDLVAERFTAPPPDDAQTVKSMLVALGAPLRGVDPVDVPKNEEMSVLVRGVSLARRDPVVARCLPLCFWKLESRLDMKALEALTASRPEEKHALGFFLQLTGELSGDRRLVGLAEPLRDLRMKTKRDFFLMPVRRSTSRDFPLADAWGFKMNTDLDSFRVLFEKFRSSI
jgi:hypothetical protein